MVKKKIILVFAGVIGSGKTTASKYIVDNYDFSHLSYVDLIWRPILDERKLPFTRDNLQDLGEELREKYGIEQLAQMIYPFIKSEKCVIDDVRSPKAYLALEPEKFKKILIFIKTETHHRVPRLKERDNLRSVSELEKVEKRKTELEIDQLEELADFVITNNADLNDFHRKLDQCVSSILD